MPKPERCSPIADEDEALALPGSSTYDRILDELLKVFYFGMCAAGLVFFTLAQWIDHWLPGSAPFRYVVTFCAILIAPVCVTIAVRAMRRAGDAALGLRGEKYVGEKLERLRSIGYEVFHDLPGKPLAKLNRRWNIDHVIVGPAGIFAIETKTWRKFAGRSQKMQFDGSMLKLDGRALPDQFKDPVAQSARNARRVAEVLKASTGRDFKVRSVLTFPGWFVEMDGAAWRGDVWVVNPKGLQKLLPQQPPVLSREEIALATDRIDVYLRDARQKKA